MSSTEELVPGPMRLVDKASLSWLVPLSIIRASISFVLRTADSSSSLQWHQRLIVSVLRAVQRTLNSRHTFAYTNQRLTGSSVKAYCCDHGLSYFAISVTLPEHPPVGTLAASVPSPTLHVVTPANAPTEGPTLLYVHGGGYLYAMQALAHMPFALRCAASCSASRLVFLEYSLSSDHGYPVQLIQIVAAVKHMLQHAIPGTNMTGGLKPEDLIIAGDSAGGHLIVSLLAHAVRPSPYATPLTEISGESGKQLRGIALFSPWVAMKLTDASLVANHKSDYISAQQLDVMGRLFKPSSTDIWALPIEVDDAVDVWKTAFPSTSAVKDTGPTRGPVAKRIIITSGAAEILFDSCVKFGELIRADTVVLDSADKVAMAACKGSVLTIAGDEAHVQPIIDSTLGYTHGWSMKAITAFLQTI